MLDFSFEEQYYGRGYNCVCGIDEAGRGPLAGPVVAACVILKRATVIEGLDDSKKLSEKKRIQLYDEIIANALDYSIALVSEHEIDRINILQATFAAMRETVARLKIKPDIVLVDGNRLPGLDIDSEAIVKGDSKCASIAAASVLAKVTRDNLMLEVDKVYPQYGFAKHKGYPTKFHYEMINKYGISDVHRHSFLKNLKDHG